jgi:Predicted dehydrogenases and related proteins
VAALAAGKNIFLEKPLATTLEDCLAIRSAQKKSGAQVFFGFCLRYAPHFRRVKQIVTSGDLGDILSFEFNETLFFSHGGYIVGNWRRLTKNAGPHILEKCSHDMDIANWLLGSRAVRVASFGGRNFFTPKYKHIQERSANPRR